MVRFTHITHQQNFERDIFRVHQSNGVVFFYFGSVVVGNLTIV